VIILPLARPGYLRSFSIALGLLVGLLLGALTYSLGPETSFAFAAVPAVGLPSVSLLWPGSISFQYKLWNTTAIYFARFARFFITGICFYVILFAVGRAGTSMKLVQPAPGQSLWLPKNTLSLETYPYEFAACGKEPPETGWLGRYWSWAKTSGQLWAFCLVPLLAMLAAVEVYRDERFPAGVYTLF